MKTLSFGIALVYANLNEIISFRHDALGVMAELESLYKGNF